MFERTGVRWWLLLGLGLMVLAIVAALVYARFAGLAAPAPVAELASGGTTARQAFAPAAGLAAEWHEDARLAVVSGRWPAVGVRMGDEGEWAFQFFSPSTQRLVLIVVAGDAARLVRESVSPYPMPTFSADAWRVDSDRALGVWWNEGGNVLVTRRPDTDLLMQLRVPEEGDGGPVWIVIGLVPGTETALTVAVDATEGTLVDQ